MTWWVAFDVFGVLVAFATGLSVGNERGKALRQRTIVRYIRSRILGSSDMVRPVLSNVADEIQRGEHLR